MFLFCFVSLPFPTINMKQICKNEGLVVFKLYYYSVLSLIFTLILLVKIIGEAYKHAHDNIKVNISF